MAFRACGLRRSALFVSAVEKLDGEKAFLDYFSDETLPLQIQKLKLNYSRLGQSRPEHNENATPPPQTGINGAH
ncbi:hypothetical protein CFAM422_010505 [Trichoderma lentiforme]|uniref:Uncharacterized protein n=1 Tax=Trichoderma lentiforme TaxID=1567552 RepID=A0A9P4X8N2_9HYPO|nr:hypothetical protein CFAM422_010505 [Trichoderma lentiforme]